MKNYDLALQLEWADEGVGPYAVQVDGRGRPSLHRIFAFLDERGGLSR